MSSLLASHKNLILRGLRFSSPWFVAAQTNEKKDCFYLNSALDFKISLFVLIQNESLQIDIKLNNNKPLNH